MGQYDYRGKTPGQLSDELMDLSYQYSEMSDRLAMVLNIKREKWLLFREEVTSDKQAERIWEGTSAGIEEMQLRLKMKANERMMSAIKKYIEVKTNEAKGQY